MHNSCGAFGGCLARQYKTRSLVGLLYFRPIIHDHIDMPVVTPIASACMFACADHFLGRAVSHLRHLEVHKIAEVLGHCADNCNLKV